MGVLPAIVMDGSTSGARYSGCWSESGKSECRARSQRIVREVATGIRRQLDLSGRIGGRDIGVFRLEQRRSRRNFDRLSL